MLKTIPLLLLTACLVFAGCRRYAPNSTQYVTIPDATREQFFTLTRLGSHAAPASARLRVIGKIESTATLVVLIDGHPGPTLQLPAGPVDTEWHGDWSSNQMSLHYLPGTVKSGALQIAYQFSD